MEVLEWTYLLSAQSIILLAYYLLRNKFETFALNSIFQSRSHFLVMNLGVIITCCYLNIQRQLFCIPVPWTMALLVLFCISFLSFPFVNKNAKLFPIVAAFAGLGFFISVYIILFGRHEYLLFIASNFVAAIIIRLITLGFNIAFKGKVINALWFYAAFVLTPYFLIYQLVLLFKSLQTTFLRRCFILSSVACLFVGLILSVQIHRILKRIAASDNIEAELRAINTNPVNNYLVELIIGAHWKYHTDLCNYDGWRPPFHDPVLVIANKTLFPFSKFYSGTNLYSGPCQDLYSKLYPDNPRTFDCRCARHELLFDLN